MQGVHAAILKSDLSDFQTLAKNDDAAAWSTPVKMDLAESTLKEWDAADRSQGHRFTILEE